MKNPSSDSNFIPLSALTAGARDAGQWRNLDELAQRLGTSQPAPEQESSADDSEWIDPLSRRRFLQLAGASMALAGVTGCTRQPRETIVPYVNPPENAVPGKPQFYATAVPVGGMAQGVLVESHLGRPTKIEGNPDHPASLGATSVHSQASVLDLYDPDRSKNILHLGLEESWEAFVRHLNEAMDPIRARQGAGLHILTEPVTSPTLGTQLQTILTALPQAKWHQYSAVETAASEQAAQAVFGRPLNTLYDFTKADVVVSLDADFLACGEPSTRYAHDFAARRAGGERTDMNRLYVVETMMTPTGGKADHRLPLRYGQVQTFATALAAAVHVPTATAFPAGDHAAWIAAVSQDLLSHLGRSVIIAGAHQPVAVHAMVHAINAALGNIGSTVLYTEPLQVQLTDGATSLRELVTAMDAGQVELLLIFGGNPCYDAPADFDFSSHLGKVKQSIRCSLYADETSGQCTWHLPQLHFLEDWSDARAYDGTVTILQPLIDPLYDSHSPLEVLELLPSDSRRTSYNIVRDRWKSQAGNTDFESWWRQSIHDGLVAGSALPQIHPSPVKAFSAPSSPPPASGLEVVFRPDPYLFDGRFANNTWLMELPQPMTKLTWDNAVYIGSGTAERLHLKTHDFVELQLDGRTVRGGVWVMAGQPDDSVTLHLGWGRWQAGRAGNGAGFDANRLRPSNALWYATGLQLRKLDGNAQLATTQMQQTMEGRDLVIAATLDHYRSHPDFVREKSREPEPDKTLYPKWDYPGYAWGMSIDLTRCVNCNACVVACQAENNIPVVGKEQVLARRAMHWLRIDTYYEGDAANPRAHYQPVPCMQCEDAPCEVVCPVQATNHSDEGLNDMVYNRCVGTRYCSNNCPYKVRRFNFVLYQDWTTESIKLQRNPDVTVRSRGVMEKCTYCVQRIREADIDTQVHDTRIRDGQVKTACQQSCPTEAIIFGDINDHGSRVAKQKAENLNYALLAELNTRPRTTYLAELRNPNQHLEKEQA